MAKALKTRCRAGYDLGIRIGPRDDVRVKYSIPSAPDSAETEPSYMACIPVLGCKENQIMVANENLTLVFILQGSAKRRGLGY